MSLCWKETCTKLVSIDLCQVAFRALHRPIRRADECYWRREVNNIARYELLPHWSILRRYFTAVFQNMQFPTPFIPIQRAKEQEISCRAVWPAASPLRALITLRSNKRQTKSRDKQEKTNLHSEIIRHVFTVRMYVYIYIIDAGVHNSGSTVVRTTRHCTVAKATVSLLHFFPHTHRYVQHFTYTKQKSAT